MHEHEGRGVFLLLLPFLLPIGQRPISPPKTWRPAPRPPDDVVRWRHADEQVQVTAGKEILGCSFSISDLTSRQIRKQKRTTRRIPVCPCTSPGLAPAAQKLILFVPVELEKLTRNLLCEQRHGLSFKFIQCTGTYPDSHDNAYNII